MTKIRYVDFYADEWLVGTMGLSVVDVGVYIQACALIYSRGGPIEKDDLRRFVVCHGRTFEAALRHLADAGKLTVSGSKISSNRCQNTLETSLKRVQKWAENGAKGGRPRNNINDLPKPNGSLRACEGNQDLNNRILESKTQDSVAPLPRARAHEGGPSDAADAGAPAPINADPPEREQRDAEEQDALTPEERAERVAILDAVLEGLRGGTPKPAPAHNPAAHRQAVTEHKRDAWLRDLHQWASGRLDGAQRMQAWEAIDCAIAAGSRDATPRHVRKHLDRLDRFRKAETSQLRGAA